MTTDKTKAHGIRLPVDFTLDAKDIKILIIKGKELFRLAQFTPEARQYLADNPDLSEVIDKW